MECKINDFEQNETNLFFRMDGEAAERHGAIGYMRADFGRSGDEFWTTWFNSQSSLNTSPFKAEFDKVINHLRYDMQYPVFGSRRELEAFCLKHSGQKINDRGIGFKIQTTDYTYYVRCQPTAQDYEAYVFAYDNRFLLPELAGEHDLPHTCFSILPSTGEMIILYRGESRYRPFTTTAATQKDIRLTANTLNEAMNVTRAQEEAMLAGSVTGNWDAPAAKPWNYNQNGKPRLIPKNKTEHER